MGTIVLLSKSGVSGPLVVAGIVIDAVFASGGDALKQIVPPALRPCVGLPFN
jgi:hypothetical protein